jgi:two-component system sensor histidine kinase KdpD
LLSAIQKEEAAQRRGRLKVFLGMCAGVGKTFAMLEAARRELAAGRDVVVGYVETHGRKETDALTEGLPALPRRPLEYRGVQLTEFDLDATLARRPQLVLVDEFAHTNAPGSRHPKRCQDVLELLDAGIDVFTTLNVQHLESRADAVRQISGITIHETVPDTALADADLELVDLPPDELRARLSAGKVYLPDRAATAQDNFFRPGNLSALRELALRFVAEHVGQDVRDYRLTHGVADPWKSGQRLLVAVSASPTSASLVRWACRLAGELKAPWIAAYVESPGPLDDEEQKRLAEHLALARQLGAEIITTSDSDLVAGLLRVAREQNVTQLVVGKPAGWRALDLLRGGSFLNRLIRASGDIDVHAVRAESGALPGRVVRRPSLERWDWRGPSLALGSVAGVTCVGLILKPWTGYQAIALIYLLAVVVLGLFVRRGAVFIASLLSAGLWNLLFVPPLFRFWIDSPSDWMSFLALLVVGLVVGQLTARLRAQQLAERSREQRATALYLLTRQFAQSADLVQLLGVIVRQVGESFRADVALALPGESSAAPLTSYFASTWTLSEKELSVAVWAFQHRQPAGRDTDTLASAEGLHLPLLAGERAAGVLSLRFRDTPPLLPAQRDLLDAFIRQIALVLDRQRLRDAETQAKLLAESERLGKTLLNSVSHELRTPLAAISSAVSGLREAGPLTSAQQNLAGELDEAAARLDRLVRNLLDLSRLEAGHLRANLDWHDLRDVVRSATDYLGRALARHPVKLNLPADLPPVKLDFALTEQILANLLGNAARHTPPGTNIEVRARLDLNQLIFEVSDHGPGLPPGDPMRLFDRFQRGPGATAGGTGLGLSLVKGFTETQGGTVTAASRAEGGAVFTVRLPRVALPPLPEEKE